MLKAELEWRWAEAQFDSGVKRDSTEVVNMVANVDGSMRIPAMGVNAVLIQLLEVKQDDGTTKLQRFVSIQCEDESLLPALREEARAVLEFTYAARVMG